MYHRQFYYDTDKVNPVDIARRDHLEYFIDSISAFEGDIKRVSTLRFHVKWLGYDGSNNSWERLKNLMDAGQFHRYLISVNLRHLIPRKFHLKYDRHLTNFFFTLVVFQEVLVSKSLT